MGGVTTQREFEVPIMNNLIAQAAATPLADSIRLIPLTQGKFAIVDAADFEFLNQWKWFAHNPHDDIWYANRSGEKINRRQATIKMHRVLMDAPRGIQVDHRDGNGLNNRISNLRLATSQQNACNRKREKRNTSGYKGVCWAARERKWRAEIKSFGRKKFLGHFDNKQEAAEAYARASAAIHGEFSRTA